MVKMLRRKGKPVLSVRARPGQSFSIDVSGEFQEVSEGRFTELLGLIVAQAFNDGMGAIQLGADPSSGNSWLRYYGPRDGEGGKSWQMTPPPFECYAALVKAVVGATVFATGADAVGTMSVEINGEALDIRVSLRSWHDIWLRWSDVSEDTGEDVR